MSEKININQVEKITGVSKRNIRFYEQEGLLLPTRNRDNGYRIYSQDDIRRVKVIKLLRMLDMPLDEIRKVLSKEEMLSAAVTHQQAELKQRAKELQAAISFCDRLKNTKIDALDVDRCLREIAKKDQKGFFTKWVEDYKCVLRSNQDMEFTFVPEAPITNAREFTAALCAFADKEHIDLVMTKESMYPEFLLDGVAYVAERNYSAINRVPIAVVSCRRKDGTIRGDAVAEPRKRFQWQLHRWGGLIAAVLVYGVLTLPRLLPGGMTWEEIAIFGVLLVLVVCMAFRGLILHYNDKSQ